MRKSLLLFFSLVAICCVLYPAILWMIGQLIFPFQANGSLLRQGETPIGSKLIAQEFTRDIYFHPRPSAASYDASASAASCLAASNIDLRTRVAKTIRSLPKDLQKNVPADFVTTSCSGLDPHITLQNAKLQLGRVASALSAKTGRDVKKELEEILKKQTFAPWNGLIGDEMINVLEANLEIQNTFLK